MASFQVCMVVAATINANLSFQGSIVPASQGWLTSFATNGGPELHCCQVVKAPSDFAGRKPSCREIDHGKENVVFCLPHVQTNIRRLLPIMDGVQSCNITT